MNLRETLREIRISPERYLAKRRIVEKIRQDFIRRFLQMQQNPEIRPSTPSRFWELLHGDRKRL